MRHSDRNPSYAEQNYRIRRDVRDFVEKSNRGYSGTRAVNVGSALEVARRVISESWGETYSDRRFKVLSEVSEFVSLLQRNKTPRSRSPKHTDLLPVSHPSSTKSHLMSEESLAVAKSRWYADDPRISDERVAPLLSSAFRSGPETSERKYALTRLESLPEGTVPAGVLLAARSYSPRALTAGFFDGNSAAARRARVALQRRDRYGRWVEMGGIGSAFIRGIFGNERSASVRRLTGVVVGQSEDGQYTYLEVSDGTIYRVPTGSVDGSPRAILRGESTPNGLSTRPARIKTGDPVVNVEDVVSIPAPPGFDTDLDGGRSTDGAYDVLDISLLQRLLEEEHADRISSVEERGDRRRAINRLLRNAGFSSFSWEKGFYDNPVPDMKKKIFDHYNKQKNEGRPVAAIGGGQNEEYDPSKPLYLLKRSDEEIDNPDGTTEIVPGPRMGVVQTWVDAQRLMDEDEPRYSKNEKPNPNVKDPRYKTPRERIAAQETALEAIRRELADRLTREVIERRKGGVQNITDDRGRVIGRYVSNDERARRATADALREKLGEDPFTDDEWENLERIVQKYAGRPLAETSRARRSRLAKESRRDAERRRLADELYRLEMEDWKDPRNRKRNFWRGGQSEWVQDDQAARRRRINNIRRKLGLPLNNYDPDFYFKRKDGKRNEENAPKRYIPSADGQPERVSLELPNLTSNDSMENELSLLEKELASGRGVEVRDGVAYLDKKASEAYEKANVLRKLLGRGPVNLGELLGDDDFPTDIRTTVESDEEGASPDDESLRARLELEKLEEEERNTPRIFSPDGKSEKIDQARARRRQKINDIRNALGLPPAKFDDDFYEKPKAKLPPVDAYQPVRQSQYLDLIDKLQEIFDLSHAENIDKAQLLELLEDLDETLRRLFPGQMPSIFDYDSSILNDRSEAGIRKRIEKLADALALVNFATPAESHESMLSDPDKRKWSIFQGLRGSTEGRKRAILAALIRGELTTGEAWDLIDRLEIMEKNRLAAMKRNGEGWYAPNGLFSRYKIATPMQIATALVTGNLERVNDDGVTEVLDWERGAVWRPKSESEAEGSDAGRAREASDEKKEFSDILGEIFERELQHSEKLRNAGRPRSESERVATPGVKGLRDKAKKLLIAKRNSIKAAIKDRDNLQRQLDRLKDKDQWEADELRRRISEANSRIKEEVDELFDMISLAVSMEAEVSRAFRQGDVPDPESLDSDEERRAYYERLLEYEKREAEKNLIWLSAAGEALGDVYRALQTYTTTAWLRDIPDNLRTPEEIRGYVLSVIKNKFIGDLNRGVVRARRSNPSAIFEPTRVLSPEKPTPTTPTAPTPTAELPVLPDIDTDIPDELGDDVKQNLVSLVAALMSSYSDLKGYADLIASDIAEISRLLREGDIKKALSMLKNLGNMWGNIARDEDDVSTGNALRRLADAYEDLASALRKVERRTEVEDPNIIPGNSITVRDLINLLLGNEETRKNWLRKRLLAGDKDSLRNQIRIKAFMEKGNTSTVVRDLLPVAIERGSVELDGVEHSLEEVVAGLFDAMYGNRRETINLDAIDKILAGYAESLKERIKTDVSGERSRLLDRIESLTERFNALPDSEFKRSVTPSTIKLWLEENDVKILRLELNNYGQKSSLFGWDEELDRAYFELLRDAYTYLMREDARAKGNSILDEETSNRVIREIEAASSRTNPINASFIGNLRFLRLAPDAMTAESISEITSSLTRYLAKNVRERASDDKFGIAYREAIEMLERIERAAKGEKTDVDGDSEVDQNRQRRQEEASSLLESDEARQVLDNVSRLIQGLKPAIVVSPETFDEIISSGQVKNGFETLRRSGIDLSAGNAYLDERRRVENLSLGIAEDAESSERPVYGVLTDPSNPVGGNPGPLSSQVSLPLGAAAYGTIALIFRDGVMDRTTFTVGDSIGNASSRRASGRPYDVASPATNVTAESVAMAGGERIVDPSTGIVPYIEAQISGPLLLRDVDHIFLGETTVEEATRAAEEIQKKLNVPIKIDVAADSPDADLLVSQGWTVERIGDSGFDLATYPQRQARSEKDIEVSRLSREVENVYSGVENWSNDLIPLGLSLDMARARQIARDGEWENLKDFIKNVILQKQEELSAADDRSKNLYSGVIEPLKNLYRFLGGDDSDLSARDSGGDDGEFTVPEGIDEILQVMNTLSEEILREERATTTALIDSGESGKDYDYVHDADSPVSRLRGLLDQVLEAQAARIEAEEDDDKRNILLRDYYRMIERLARLESEVARTYSAPDADELSDDLDLTEADQRRAFEYRDLAVNQLPYVADSILRWLDRIGEYGSESANAVREAISRIEDQDLPEAISEDDFRPAVRDLSLGILNPVREKISTLSRPRQVAPEPDKTDEGDDKDDTAGTASVLTPIKGRLKDILFEMEQSLKNLAQLRENGLSPAGLLERVEYRDLVKAFSDSMEPNNDLERPGAISIRSPRGDLLFTSQFIYAALRGSKNEDQKLSFLRRLNALIEEDEERFDYDRQESTVPVFGRDDKSYLPNVTTVYVPVGGDEGSSQRYTDDPSEIAPMFPREELIESLRNAVVTDPDARPYRFALENSNFIQSLIDVSDWTQEDFNTTPEIGEVAGLELDYETLSRMVERARDIISGIGEVSPVTGRPTREPTDLERLDAENFIAALRVPNSDGVVILDQETYEIADLEESATGYALLTFDPSGGEEVVPAEAVYAALLEQGERADIILQDIFNGGTGNVTEEDLPLVLSAARTIFGDDVFLPRSKPTQDAAPSGDGDEPTVEEIRASLPEAFQGLTDDEIVEFMRTGDYSSLLLDNERFDADQTAGLWQISSEPFIFDPDQVPPTYPSTYSNDPLEMARNLSIDEMVEGLRYSITNSESPGYATITIYDENGEEFFALFPAEALRDALQLRAVDTNEIIRNVYGVGRGDAPAGNEAEEAAKAAAKRADSFQIATIARSDAENKMTKLGRKLRIDELDSPFVVEGSVFDSFSPYAIVLGQVVSSDGTRILVGQLPDGSVVAKTFDGDLEEVDVYAIKEFSQSSLDETPFRDPDKSYTLTDSTVKEAIGQHDDNKNVYLEVDGELYRVHSHKARKDGKITLKLLDRDGYITARIVEESDKVSMVDASADDPNTGDDAPTTRPPRRVKISASALPDLVGEGRVAFSERGWFFITKAEISPDGKRVELTTYSPGHQIQNTKVYQTSSAIDLILDLPKDIVPPPGDLPPISKRSMGIDRTVINDFIKDQIDRGVGSVSGVLKELDEDGNETGWVVPADPDIYKVFDVLRKDYERRIRNSKELWSVPDNVVNDIPSVSSTSSTDESGVIKPLPDGSGVFEGNAVDILPGDIILQPVGPNGEIAYFSVLSARQVLVKGTKKDLIKKVEVTGFYPGHGIQTFYMDERVYAKTQPKLRILRNSPKRPKIGNLAPIDVDLDDPDKNSPDVLAEISASTKRARMPKSVLFAKPAKMPEYTYPPFFGTGLIEALQRFDGDPKKLAEWLSEQTVIYYDFETTGGLDSPTPIQISAVKYRNGEVVGRKNIFMNPGAKLDFFYTSKIEQGDPNILRDTDGNPISDEFLADQPPIKEALQEFIDFIDEGSILVAHNQVFDFEILMDYAKKLNIELPEDGFISGLIDTLTLSRRAYPGERIPHYLEAAVIREGVKIDDEEVKKGDARFHNADFDSEVLYGLLERLLGKLSDDEVDLLKILYGRPSDEVNKRNVWRNQRRKFLDFMSGLVIKDAIQRAMDGDEVDLDKMIDALRLRSSETDSDSDSDGVATPKKKRQKTKAEKKDSAEDIIAKLDVDALSSLLDKIDKREDDLDISDDLDIMEDDLAASDDDDDDHAAILKELETSLGQELTPELVTSIKRSLQDKKDDLEDTEPSDPDYVDNIKEAAKYGVILRALDKAQIAKTRAARSPSRTSNANATAARPANAQSGPGPQARVNTTTTTTTNPSSPNSNGASVPRLALVDATGASYVDIPLNSDDPVTEFGGEDSSASFDDPPTTRNPNIPHDDYDYSGASIQPTEQQAAIISAITKTEGTTIIIKALAGAGKTTTLKMAARRLAEERPDERILYIVYNKANQLEAEEDFADLDNIEVYTNSKLAWNYAEKLGLTKKSGRNPSYLTDSQWLEAVAVELVGDDNNYVELNGRLYRVDQMANWLRFAYKNFLLSDSDAPGREHFAGWADTDDLPFPTDLITLLERAFADANDPDGKMPFKNEHADKIWALSRPDPRDPDSIGSTVSATRVFVDEAQDTNPVFAGLLRRIAADPELQLVAVGDPNQAVYEFRGAVDQMSKLEADFILPLSETRRFGPNQAEFANIFLALRGVLDRVDAARDADGNFIVNDRVLPAGGLTDPDVIIFRNNFEIWGTLVEMINNGQRVGLDSRTMAEAANAMLGILDLARGKRPRVEELQKFASFRDFMGSVQSDRIAGKWWRILGAVAKNLPPEKRENPFELLNEFANVVAQVELVGPRRKVFYTEDRFGKRTYWLSQDVSEDSFIEAASRVYVRRSKENAKKKYAAGDPNRKIDNFLETILGSIGIEIDLIDSDGNVVSTPLPKRDGETNEEWAARRAKWLTDNADKYKFRLKIVPQRTGGRVKNSKGQYVDEYTDIKYEIEKIETYTNFNNEETGETYKVKVKDPVTQEERQEERNRMALMATVDTVEEAVRVLNELREALLPKDMRAEKDAGSRITQLITAHRSKGLEWDKVLIGDGFIDSMTPTDKQGNALTPEETDGELRLAYVAVSRGKYVLDPGMLSWVYDAIREGKTIQDLIREREEREREERAKLDFQNSRGDDQSDDLDIGNDDGTVTRGANEDSSGSYLRRQPGFEETSYWMTSNAFEERTILDNVELGDYIAIDGISLYSEVLKVLEYTLNPETGDVTLRVADLEGIASRFLQMHVNDSVYRYIPESSSQAYVRSVPPSSGREGDQSYGDQVRSVVDIESPETSETLIRAATDLKREVIAGIEIGDYLYFGEKNGFYRLVDKNDEKSPGASVISLARVLGPGPEKLTFTIPYNQPLLVVVPNKKSDQNVADRRAATPDSDPNPPESGGTGPTRVVRRRSAPKPKSRTAERRQRVSPRKYVYESSVREELSQDDITVREFVVASETAQALINIFYEAGGSRDEIDRALDLLEKDQRENINMDLLRSMVRRMSARGAIVEKSDQEKAEQYVRELVESSFDAGADAELMSELEGLDADELLENYKNIGEDSNGDLIFKYIRLKYKDSARILPNGHLLVKDLTVGTQKYQVVLARSPDNNFFIYTRRIDLSSGRSRVGLAVEKTGKAERFGQSGFAQFGSLNKIISKLDSMLEALKKAPATLMEEKASIRVSDEIYETIFPEDDINPNRVKGSHQSADGTVLEVGDAVKVPSIETGEDGLTRVRWITTKVDKKHWIYDKKKPYKYLDYITVVKDGKPVDMPSKNVIAIDENGIPRGPNPAITDRQKEEVRLEYSKMSSDIRRRFTPQEYLEARERILTGGEDFDDVFGEDGQEDDLLVEGAIDPAEARTRFDQAPPRRIGTFTKVNDDDVIKILKINNVKYDPDDVPDVYKSGETIVVIPRRAYIGHMSSFRLEAKGPEEIKKLYERYGHTGIPIKSNMTPEKILPIVDRISSRYPGGPMIISVQESIMSKDGKLSIVGRTFAQSNKDSIANDMEKALFSALSGAGVYGKWVGEWPFRHVVLSNYMIEKSFEDPRIFAATTGMSLLPDVNPLEYTLVHEWGHVIDRMIDNVRLSVASSGYYEKQKAGFSQYGQMNEREGFAEGFTSVYFGGTGPMSEYFRTLPYFQMFYTLPDGRIIKILDEDDDELNLDLGNDDSPSSALPTPPPLGFDVSDGSLVPTVNLIDRDESDDIGVPNEEGEDSVRIPPFKYRSLEAARKKLEANKVPGDPTSLEDLPEDIRRVLVENAERLFGLSIPEMEANIEAVLDRSIASAPAGELPRGYYWYDEVNDLLEAIANLYGFDQNQMIGATAATSMKEDWDSNSIIAEYIARAISEDHEVQVDLITRKRETKDIKGVGPVTKSLLSWARDAVSRSKFEGEERKFPTAAELRGKRISDLDPYVAAVIIRAHAKAGYRVNGVGGLTKAGDNVNVDGVGLRTRDKSGIAYNSGVSGMGRAVRILRGEENNYMLNGHKVRSFSNNMNEIDDGSVTVDSHAFAISMGNPEISSGSPEYDTFNDGYENAPYGIKGYYAVVAEAYRRVAARRNMDLRRVQSITWTQWRTEKGIGEADGPGPAGYRGPDFFGGGGRPETPENGEDDDNLEIKEGPSSAQFRLPEEPFTTPIPEGHIRLVHQSPIPPEVFLREGIDIEKARGIEGPRAVWAAEPENGRGFYGSPSTYSGTTVEFSVPEEEWIGGGAFARSVRPEEIIAVHEPWHSFARKWLGDPEILEEIRSGSLSSEYFYSVGGDYAKAYDYVAKTLNMPEKPTQNLSEASYRGSHSAPDRDYGAPASDLSGIYPSDVYSLEGLRYYASYHGGTPQFKLSSKELSSSVNTQVDLDRRVWSMLMDMRGDPDRIVNIYRAVPLDAPNDISQGDWVTIVPEYARDHGLSALRGSFKILRGKARAGDIFTNGDSWMEWGWDPADGSNRLNSRVYAGLRDYERITNLDNLSVQQDSEDDEDNLEIIDPPFESLEDLENSATTLYHGTPARFSVFNSEDALYRGTGGRTRAQSRSQGYFYFTEDESVAERFARKYVDIDVSNFLARRDLFSFDEFEDEDLLIELRDEISRRLMKTGRKLERLDDDGNLVEITPDDITLDLIRDTDGSLTATLIDPNVISTRVFGKTINLDLDRFTERDLPPGLFEALSKDDLLEPAILGSRFFKLKSWSQHEKSFSNTLEWMRSNGYGKAIVPDDKAVSGGSSYIALQEYIEYGRTPREVAIELGVPVPPPDTEPAEPLSAEEKDSRRDILERTAATLYHGSPAEPFERFDSERATYRGQGERPTPSKGYFYFTSDPTVATWFSLAETPLDDIKLNFVMARFGDDATFDTPGVVEDIIDSIKGYAEQTGADFQRYNPGSGWEDFDPDGITPDLLYEYEFRWLNKTPNIVETRVFGREIDLTGDLSEQREDLIDALRADDLLRDAIPGEEPGIYMKNWQYHEESFENTLEWMRKNMYGRASVVDSVKDTGGSSYIVPEEFIEHGVGADEVARRLGLYGVDGERRAKMLMSRFSSAVGNNILDEVTEEVNAGIEGMKSRGDMTYDRILPLNYTFPDISRFAGAKRATYELAYRQGFTDLPTSVSSEEFDALAASGFGTVVYRGLSGGVPDRNEPDGSGYAQQLISGDYWIGDGTSGSGTYMTTLAQYAIRYAANDIYSDGAVVRAILIPNARILSSGADRQIVSGFNNSPFSSISEYAVAMGYDVYKPDSSYNFLVFNRTALIFDGTVRAIAQRETDEISGGGLDAVLNRLFGEGKW